MSTGGNNGRYRSNHTKLPTKYLNFGNTCGLNVIVNVLGIDTGFYVTPSISNALIAVSLLFATTNDAPNHDAITVILEGSNIHALGDGLSWTLICNGSTGISPTIDSGRQQYGAQQNFSNTIVYKSYRFLITSQHGSEWTVQYLEVQIIGYV